MYRPTFPSLSVIPRIRSTGSIDSGASYNALQIVRPADVLNSVGVVQVALPSASQLTTWDFSHPLIEGTGDFPPAYEQRVRSFARLATSAGGHVIWVGLPNPRDTRRWDFIERQNGAFQAVADELPNVAYFDTWDTFAAPGGGYTAYYRDGKQLTLVRADDGVHFNADGYTILMRSIAQFATQQFGLDPRTYEG